MPAVPFFGWIGEFFTAHCIVLLHVCGLVLVLLELDGGRVTDAWNPPWITGKSCVKAAKHKNLWNSHHLTPSEKNNSNHQLRKQIIMNDTDGNDNQDDDGDYDDDWEDRKHTKRQVE